MNTKAQVQQRKIALYVYLFIPGLALASWVTRTPAIRDAIGASIAQMGMVLAGLSIGSMCGVLISGKIIQRKGTRFTMLLGLAMVCVSVLIMALGTLQGQQALVALGLSFFGLGIGAADIAINMDAALVENESGQHIMHTLHGCFSLGVLVGALLGLTANALYLSVPIHLTVIFVIVSSLLWKFSNHVPAGFGIQNAESKAAQRAAARLQSSVWCDPRVLMIGFVVFALALTEGAAYDWLPILLVDEHNFNEALGALVFVLFAFMMTVGRFSGGWLLQRFGRLTVIRASIVLAATGVACIALGDSHLLAGIAVLCWGLGTALGFPLALSAAAEGGGRMAERVKAVATIGYIALLVGPPSLGFVGQVFGLRGAMLVVLSFIVLSVFLSGAMRTVTSNNPRS